MGRGGLLARGTIPLDIKLGADRLPALPDHQDLPGLPVLLRHGWAKAERVFLGRAAWAGRRSA